MLIQAVTIFPEMFDSITRYGVTGRANRQGIWQFEAVNPRNQYIETVDTGSKTITADWGLDY